MKTRYRTGWAILRFIEKLDAWWVKFRQKHFGFRLSASIQEERNNAALLDDCFDTSHKLQKVNAQGIRTFVRMTGGTSCFCGHSSHLHREIEPEMCMVEECPCQSFESFPPLRSKDNDKVCWNCLGTGYKKIEHKQSIPVTVKTICTSCQSYQNRFKKR